MDRDMRSIVPPFPVGAVTGWRVEYPSGRKHATMGRMSTIKEQLRQDLTSAMKSGQTEVVATIRMALTSISKAEVSGDAAKELSNDETVSVLASETKRRREAAGEFEKAGRDDLADKEKSEADILARYLPQPLSAEELQQLVQQAVAAAQEQGLAGGRAMGSVMKDLKDKTLGRVDGAELAATVKRELGIGQ